MNEQASRESLQNGDGAADFQDLFENAPCGYLSLDPEGRITRVNRTFTSWTGHSGETLVGRRFLDLLSVAGKIFYETHFAPMLRMQGFFNEVAFDLRCAEGAVIPVLVNAVERLDGTGRARSIRMTILAASDRRKYEQELLEARRAAERASRELREVNLTLEARVEEAVQKRLRAEEALRQAQKMEAIGQLTGGVAHDFNNLLTVILGSLELLQRRMPPDPILKRFADAAEDAARRGAQVNAQLLAFSRRQPLQAVTVDAREVVQGISGLLERTVNGVATLEFKLPQQAIPIHVDRNQLEMALLNLVVNARDASPGGGRILVEGCRGMVDGSPAGIWISVIDEGEGMTPEVLERVFEPFFTTKAMGAGTGLGLSMVYGFVRQSGGDIDIVSARGAGTTIRLRLPDAGVVLPPTEEASPLVEVRPSDGESILVVDDDSAVRAIAVSTLEQLGYPIHQANSGEAALRLLQAGLKVDLLFTDVAMPGRLNGIELAREARRLRPDLRILVTSGRLPEGLDLDAVWAAGGKFLSKPFHPLELALSVQSLLDGENQLPSAAAPSHGPGTAAGTP
ncbi:hypothetical protein BKE38_03760 [Pseudoroseomonas deserti]|uniref:histidine kinase n=1 Tax=Teichococcus deserti TaxID=1817963 RepID=A0A1V2H724_9PROT|nr:PAS domain-containing hybrid sensor histidine kinase/response regulator [Pseudoroseomonas deserti]ONG57893.1 hypothetical protein BKE38_03760 [Pseudoroseomonas deserti]